VHFGDIWCNNLLLSFDSFVFLFYFYFNLKGGTYDCPLYGKVTVLDGHDRKQRLTTWKLLLASHCRSLYETRTPSKKATYDCCFSWLIFTPSRKAMRTCFATVFALFFNKYNMSEVFILILYLFLFYFILISRGERTICPFTVRILFWTDMIENRGLLPESYS